MLHHFYATTQHSTQLTTTIVLRKVVLSFLFVPSSTMITTSICSLRPLRRLLTNQCSIKNSTAGRQPQQAAAHHHHLLPVRAPVIRSYVSRAHPKPLPEYPVQEALQFVLDGIEERKAKRVDKWERNADARKAKGKEVR